MPETNVPTAAPVSPSYRITRSEKMLETNRSDARAAPEQVVHAIKVAPSARRSPVRTCTLLTGPRRRTYRSVRRQHLYGRCASGTGSAPAVLAAEARGARAEARAEQAGEVRLVVEP